LVKKDITKKTSNIRITINTFRFMSGFGGWASISQLLKLTNFKADFTE